MLEKVVMVLMLVLEVKWRSIKQIHKARLGCRNKPTYLFGNIKENFNN